MGKFIPAEVRFDRHIKRDGPAPEQRPDLGPCWLWTGSVSGGDNRGDGYGRFLVDGRFVAVHRWAYEQWVGPVPDGRELDHLCRVRRCCNPAHLEPVTRRENLVRGNTVVARQLARTHCAQGHPLDAENTYDYGDGKRRCRKCSIRWARESRERARAARQS